MIILPVLDLMKGQVVRGVAGLRAEYRPVISTLLDSAEPTEVAQVLRERFGFDEFYLADLNAIQGGSPALDVYTKLQMRGLRLWIDAGIGAATDETFTKLIELCVAGIVIGLESVAGPEELRPILQRASADRVVFSLDLKAGKSLGRTQAWGTDDPWPIARRAIGLGVNRLIVLDLARVGVGGGVGTEELCARLKQTYPEVQLIAGGGVRGIADVKRLTSIGVDRVLVASALHDGRITPDDVKQL